MVLGELTEQHLDRKADKWGLDKVYQTLVKLEKQYGLRFKPANLIKEMAETGKTFYTEG